MKFIAQTFLALLFLGAATAWAGGSKDGPHWVGRGGVTFYTVSETVPVAQGGVALGRANVELDCDSPGDLAISANGFWINGAGNPVENPLTKPLYIEPYIPMFDSVGATVGYAFYMQNDSTTHTTFSFEGMITCATQCD